MAKVFTKLNISSNADASSGHRYFKKLSADGGGGGDASLITFTVEGATYQAEAGWTWEQWIESGYEGSTSFSTSGGYVFASGWLVTDDVGNGQNANQLIVEGKAYAIAWGRTE
jgi:hypothetical protein